MTLTQRRLAWTVVLVVATLAVAHGQSADPLKGAEPAEVVGPPIHVDPEDTVGPTGLSSILGIGGLGGDEAHDFFSVGAHISESVESHQTVFGGDREPSVFALTRVFGNVQFMRFHRRSETALNYVGGRIFDNDSGLDDSRNQLHRLDFGQRFLWQTGELILGDSFGDLPGGRIDSSVFGGFLASQFGFPNDNGVSDLLGSSQFGELAQQSHVTNVALAQLTEALTARSAVTIGAAYSFTKYLDDDVVNLINSRQSTVDADYTYELNQRSTIGASVQYRSFQFPQSGADNLTTTVAQFSYQRRLSPRLTAAFGVGPEIAQVSNSFNGEVRQVNTSGYAAFGYRLRSATLKLSYNRQVTNGSGFFAGANRDTARFSVLRPLGRRWELSADIGFSRSQRLLASTTGIPADSYTSGFVNTAVQRRITPHLSAFLGYHFSAERFDGSGCNLINTCDTTEPRSLGLIGLNWHLRPIRLE